MTRVVGAALCVVVGLYWLGVGSGGSQTGGGGFRILVAVFIAACLGALLHPLAAPRIGTTALAVLTVGAIGLGLFAAFGPFLLNEWIRADSDRYMWVIRHADPCSSMGGGPGMVWVFGTSWLAAIGAFMYAAALPMTPARVACGLALGAVLLGATAAAMFPEPAVFARILGCL